MAYSLPALLIVAGLGVLALACSVFPISPTTRAATLLTIAFALAFVVPLYIALIIAVVVFALFVVDALVSAKKIPVKRNMPSQLARGVPSEFRIATSAASSPISTRGEKILATRIRQPRCADIELSEKEATNDLKGTITALRRGKHIVPPFATRITGPFGLAMWHRPTTQTHEVNVFPDLPAAQRLANSIQQGKFATAGLKRKGPLGLGTNFESVREYFPDDDSRLVNWSATARMGRPMSNQYRVEQDRDVVVLVDTGRLMTAPLPLDESSDGQHFATRLDFALNALCGIASVSDVMGDRIGVVTFDSRVRKHLKPRRAGAQAVIKTTYDIEPLPVDSDYDAAFQRVGRSKRSFVLVLTDFVDKRSAEPLVRALNIIKKKHRVVVASVVDHEIAALLDSTGAVRDDYLQASAREMSRAAQETIDYIKQSGVEVICSPHETYMVDCVKSYLQAKQRASF